MKGFPRIDPAWRLPQLQYELHRTRRFLSVAKERKFGETDEGIARAADYKLRLESAISAQIEDAG